MKTKLFSGAGAAIKRFWLRVTKRERPSGRSEEANAAHSALAAGIEQHAQVFDGLYESLFQAARNHQVFSTDAYEEWCNRVGQTDDAAFAEAFTAVYTGEDFHDELQCRERFELLLEDIHTAGIHRERESGVVCIADASMRKAYYDVNRQKLQIGAEYTVLKPAWLYGEKVVEYGLLLPGAVDMSQFGGSTNG